MLIVLVIVALVAVGLLVMYLLATRSATAYRLGAEAREAALTTERDDTRSQLAARTTERDQARTEASTRATELDTTRAQVTKLEAQSSQLSGVVRRLNGEIEGLKATSAEQAGRIEAQEAVIATLQTEKDELTARAEQAEASAEAARAEVAAAEARNAGIVIGDVLSSESGDPATLWSLELARSVRTWRTSVAANPFASPTPFDETDDPVRLAVEVEASALRENVGAFITIDWQAGPITDPARALLVVRVAQELLEAAVRNPEPLRLVATGDDEVTLRLEAQEATGHPVDLLPPSFEATDLVTATDDGGLTVTVKSS